MLCLLLAFQMTGGAVFAEEPGPSEDSAVKIIESETAPETDAQAPPAEDPAGAIENEDTKEDAQPEESEETFLPGEIPDEEVPEEEDEVTDPGTAAPADTPSTDVDDPEDTRDAQDENTTEDEFTTDGPFIDRVEDEALTAAEEALAPEAPPLIALSLLPVPDLAVTIPVRTNKALLTWTPVDDAKGYAVFRKASDSDRIRARVALRIFFMAIPPQKIVMLSGRFM